MSEVGRRVGFVFQNPDHQIFAATVEEEVAFGPENFGLEGEELDRRVADAIRTVDLDGLEGADPFNLSKGQRQRVALASILATDPDAIVFDEPTTGLDATQQETFMDLVAELNRDQGVTVAMVTHSMSTVATYAPCTVVMADGRKVADGPTRELFADEDQASTNGTCGRPSPWRSPIVWRPIRGLEDALPALSVDELVAGLGGDETRTETTDVAGKTNERGSSLYVNGDSVLHRLAPRAKIALALGVFAVALAFDHPAWVVVPFAVSLGTLLALGGLKNLMRVWFVVVAIFVVGMVVWPAFVPGGGPVVLATPVMDVTRDEVLLALGRSTRFASFIVTGLLFVTVTSNEEIVAGLRSLGVPFAFCFAVGTALRLFPTLLSATGTVRQAQEARGHDVAARSPIRRIRNYVPLLIPVFMTAIPQRPDPVDGAGGPRVRHAP